VGTTGYRYADLVTYRSDEVILEVGSGSSTRFLGGLGPPVVTIDVDLQAFSSVVALDNVEARHGRAEDVLLGWNRPIGFAWLDGYDWPYTGNPPDYYIDQRETYERRGWKLSQAESQRSHLNIVISIADYVRVVAFDDTWRTHEYLSINARQRCAENVPPATQPAPRLAMDQPITRQYCDLERNHPHHDDPDRGWSGKGGTAIPYLLQEGFVVVEYGLGLVVLRRGDDA
jgi:hypothetical protein